MKKVTLEVFKSRLQKAHGDKYIIVGDFVDLNTKILMRCTICDNEWMANPRPLYRGTGCPSCGLKIARETIKWNLTHEDFLSRIPQPLRSSINVITPYVGCHNRLKVQCLICSYEWTPKALSLTKGWGCSPCGRERKGLKSRVSPMDYIKRVEEVHNKSIAVLSTYTTGNDPIKFRCNTCKYEGTKQARTLLCRGCPNCSESKGESKVNLVLKSLGLQFQRQFSLPDLKGDKGLLRFDFMVIHEGKVLFFLEYDGSQHFRPFYTDKSGKRFAQQQKYDKIKEDYCKKYKLPLVRIPYYDYNKISSAYLQEIYDKIKNEASNRGQD